MARSSNDDRSDRFNPNNSAYHAAEANEAGQRGDDDDYDEATDCGPAEGVPNELRLHPIPLNLRTAAYPGYQPPDLRHLCGPLVLDRQSHLIRAVARILNASWGYKFESPESIRRREERVKALRAELLRHRDGLENGRVSNSWSIQDMECQLSFAENTLLFREAKYYHNEDLRSAGLEPPVWQTCGWRELLAWAIDHLRGAIGTGVGPKVIVFEGVRPLGERESPQPGEVRAQTFTSDAGAMAYVSQFASDRPGACAMTVPESNAKDVPAAFYECLKKIDWITSAVPDYTDVRPLLRVITGAAAAAEWAGYPWCVFGVRNGVIADAVCEHRASRTRREAERLADGLAQRGFRSVVFPTPPVTGVQFWLRYPSLPTYPDNDLDQELGRSPWTHIRSLWQ